MPINRNSKLVSNEQLQEFFDLFESMTKVVEGGISFPSIRAFANFEEMLPDAFTVKPPLKRPAVIRIFRNALYDCRRKGPLTADALIARAEEIHRLNRAVQPKEFTLWTKIRIYGIDRTQALNFKWGDVSIRLCGQLPRWLRLDPFHNSDIGDVAPDAPARSAYVILSCRERKEDDAVDRMLDALNLLMALMNIYQTRGSWTIMSGSNWRAGQLRMGPFQFVYQDRKFLGENRIWYDPNYDEAAWNAPHPGLEKYLEVVPFTRKALSALSQHPLKHVLVPALQISQDAFEAQEGNHRLLRFWTALEKIYVEDWNKDRSNQKVIDRATFSDTDHHLTRWQLGHISRLRNEHVHARGHGDAFMEQSQVLREIFTRHILHWIFHGRAFDSHEALLAYVDLPRTDEALLRKRKLVDRRLALNKNKQRERF
ncbi:hypothetical protein ABS767_09355 [Sphingomonas sp. ST-64]|uniref:Apea-like HEPN domain-containing protein n=1 Tax=Sphingomonas plantiphila TaxID=3163295 RepID=A0ABW8YLM0_9SPHN